MSLQNGSYNGKVKISSKQKKAAKKARNKKQRAIDPMKKPGRCTKGWVD